MAVLMIVKFIYDGKVRHERAGESETRAGESSLAEETSEVKFRPQLEEIQQRLLQTQAELESTKAVIKLDSEIESLRQLALKGEFDEVLKQADKLLATV